MITNLMSNYVKESIRNLVEDNLNNGGNYSIISLDFDLSNKHTFPLYNGNCHINSLDTFHKLKDLYHHVDIYFCLLIDEKDVFAHFIVGIKESENSELKFIDPTLGIMGLCEQTKYILFKDQKTGEFVSLFKNGLFNDVKELKKPPASMLYMFKKILIRNFISRIKKRSRIEGWIIEKMARYLLNKGHILV